MPLYCPFPPHSCRYMPPEALDRSRGASMVDAWKLDMWALGAMVLEWITMAPLWLYGRDARPESTS